MQGRPHPVMNRRIWEWTDPDQARHNTLWNPVTGQFHDWREDNPGRWTLMPYPPRDATSIEQADAYMAHYIAHY